MNPLTFEALWAYNQGQARGCTGNPILGYLANGMRRAGRSDADRAPRSRMLILALDTTTRTGSIALARGEQTLDCLVGDPVLTHGQRLPEDIVRLLDRQRLTLRDVELYAVAAGPGSFTGLRVGIATIQGLALAAARPVVAVGSLVALACAAMASWTKLALEGPAGDLIAAWMDAQRGEVFAALYETTGSGPSSMDEPPRSPFDPEAPPLGLRALEPAAVGRAEVLLRRWEERVRGRRVTFVGDAAVAGHHTLARHLGEFIHVIDPVPPLAPLVARISASRAAAGATVSPDAIRPVYVRRSDAELARGQRG